MSQGYTKGAAIDTDGTLSADSDFLIPSQKAVKTYVDNEIAGIPAPTTPDLEDVLTQGNDGGGQDIVNVAGLQDSSSDRSIDIENRQLVSSLGLVWTVDWENKILGDAAGQTSIDWESRELVDSTLVPTFDWENLIFPTLAGGGTLMLTVDNTGAITTAALPGGSTDASDTVKGITKLSVAPVSPTNPIAVGDNDPRNTDARTPIAHAATHVNGTDDIQDATVAQKGLLTATDWATFNGKLTDSMNTNKLLGRGTAGVGAIEEITLGTNLSFTGTTLNATGGSGPTFVYKTADETRVSTTSFAADSALQFSMLANTNYRIRIFAPFFASATPDIKYRINGPASPTVIAMRGITTVANAATLVGNNISSFGGTGTALTSSSSANGFIQIEGIVQNGASAGTFSLDWAQNTSDAADTTIYAGAYLEYIVI